MSAMRKTRWLRWGWLEIEFGLRVRLGWSGPAAYPEVAVRGMQLAGRRGRRIITPAVAARFGQLSLF